VAHRGVAYLLSPAADTNHPIVQQGRLLLPPSPGDLRRVGSGSWMSDALG
jgi:hypothetical protein